MHLVSLVEWDKGRWEIKRRNKSLCFMESPDAPPGFLFYTLASNLSVMWVFQSALCRIKSFYWRWLLWISTLSILFWVVHKGNKKLLCTWCFLPYSQASDIKFLNSTLHFDSHFRLSHLILHVGILLESEIWEWLMWPCLHNCRLFVRRC